MIKCRSRVCVARERERRKERMSERAMEVRLQHDNYGEPPVNYASFPALLLLLFAPLSAGRVLLLLSRSLLPAPAPLLARSTRISRDNLSRSLLSLPLPPSREPWLPLRTTTARSIGLVRCSRSRRLLTRRPSSSRSNSTRMRRRSCSVATRSVSRHAVPSARLCCITRTTCAPPT